MLCGWIKATDLFLNLLTKECPCSNPFLQGRGHSFAHEDKTDLIGTYLCESYLRDFVNFILNLEPIYISLFIFEKYL